MSARLVCFALLTLLLALPTSSWGAKKWRTKEGCTLIENEANDGDSVHVRVAKRHYIFRLLWVDTPETDDRFPERVAEQAAYFGITPQQAISVGKDSVKFSAAFLKSPFTVYTQFDDAMGSSDKDRDYAVIKSGETYLMEALVSNGLARIHGLQELPDDGPTVSTMRLRLKGFEADARKNRRGGWAFAEGAGNRFAALSQGSPIPEQELVVNRTTAVYAADDASRLMGTLTPGKTITVLRAEAGGLARIRIPLADGRTVEGMCRRSDLEL
jgi:endonuclease YncB( thermonuclease family)